jgi:2OG-Fe(II) oxygenase superfamily
MDVSRLPFLSPVLCIDHFLSGGDAETVLRECVALKELYMPANVLAGSGATKLDRTHRSNEVVYLDDVFRSDPGRSDILRIMKEKIWAEECKALWHDGYYLFDIINYSTWHEVVLSRYGDGAFYKKHRDTRRDHITHRLVTLVYYVNQRPEQFTGGALVLWEDDQYVRVDPRHNRAVIFPSFTFHEVEKVSTGSDGWDQARFSLNYWLGFR